MSHNEIFCPFLNLDIVLRISIPGEFTYISQSKRVEIIIVMKIERP